MTRSSVVAVVVAGVLLSVAYTQPPLTDLPPRVIDSSPAPFAANVDANLERISFTFDRPMNVNTQVQGNGGAVYVRSAGVMPVPREAQPSWDATGTILSLPVKLEPDVTYAVELNDSKGRPFVDQAGTPAVGFFLVFSTGNRSGEAWPPHVVKTEPEQVYAVGVDSSVERVYDWSQ